MDLNLNFTGKTVLITGATRGIGAAIANDFYLAGASVILTGTNQEKIDELNKINKKNLRKKYLQADFSENKSLEYFLSEISKFSRIDVCVNNAGVNRIDYINETALDDYDFVTKINCHAPFAICRTVSQMMINQNYGRIINIASIWGIVTKKKRSIYSLTKSGIIGLTKALSADLAPYNILVNAVSPGFTITELTESTNTEIELLNIANQIPLKRLAQPEEIAKVVLFLSSDLNTYITGQNIAVDGGYTIV
jgi:3-oxoacyl-[acyl-carrier protein] reductase